jgi:hypothetical protein
MKKLIIYMLLMLTLPVSLIGDDTKTVGTTGADYPTLIDAFFDINNGILTGVITLQIIDNTSEYATAELFESGYGGSSSYTSITIYPTSTGLTISGDLDAPLINLNGATNVTIDGRVNATGSTIDLVITNINTGASASTIQFINDALNNIIKYCTIKGSSTNTAGGIIFFSTSGTGTGNDGNTFDLNNITSDPAGRPVNTIYSAGTSGQENSGNMISNNSIYDFFSPSLLANGTSNGINISANSTAWTISGNSFYETTLFAPSGTPTVTYNAISISNTGTAFTVTGNFIGGSSASCSGTWTKTGAKNNVFYGIYMNVGTGTASSIQNNTIKNFSWSNLTNANWTGIHIAGGAVNIGTLTANIIGAATGTESIIVTSLTTNGFVYGINIAGTGTVDCQNNIIGSITTAVSSTLAYNFTGINKTATTGTTTISNNTIGSTSTANSINASSTSTSNAQTVVGISSTGTGTITISGNTIANLSNAAANTSVSSRGRVNGIVSSSGTNTISSNTIYNLTIANANDASNQIACVCGIALSGATLKTLSGNTIYNLSNTYSSFVGSVLGIFFIGNTTTNSVSGNFIHSLSVSGGTSNANIYGISMSAGATTYSNNIITLGGSTLTTVYGIYETGVASNNNSLYFNTVYIGGSVASGINKSYALYSAVTTNTRNFRNNIFFNARSTTGGSNLHYAAYIVSTGGTITCDFNDYYVSGTGGILGYYGANKTVLPIVTGQDVSSFAINPVLSNPGGTNAADYLPSAASLVAVTGTGITTDYAGTTRSITFPAMGAYEYTVAPSAWTWTGTSTTDWNTAANWNYNSVPPVSSDVIVADASNDPIVNEVPATPAECQNLTINTNGILTIAAGKALKVNGTITNNAGNTGLVIKSDANGNDGKLINNTSSVPATVELSISGGAGVSGPAFHYFVPPVESMYIGTTIPEAKTNLGITNFNGDLLLYDETKAIANKNAGWQYFDGHNGTTPFSSLTSTRGYNIYLTAADKITFTGQLNGAAHNFSLSYTGTNPAPGWNLAGNPYPCNYDLNGISVLTGSGDDVDNTVYFNNDGGYAYWNVVTGGTTGYSDIMPPMQGFFVHVTASGKTLSLPVSSKTGSAALPLRSKGTAADSDEKEAKLITVKKVKLVLSKGIQHDETIVCLIDDATPGFDSDYDAYKLFASGSTAPSFYSELSSVKYAINTVHQPPEDSQTIIPMKVEIKSAGEHTIDITEFENLGDVRVVLKYGSAETVLTQNSSYSFTATGPGTLNFELVIGEEDITTGDEHLTETEFKTWYNNDFLYINPPSEVASGPGRIIIYDMQGKSVYNNNQLYLVPDQTIQVPVNLQKGIYIVHVIVNNQPFVSKVVVF